MLAIARAIDTYPLFFIHHHVVIRNMVITVDLDLVLLDVLCGVLVFLEICFILSLRFGARGL